MIIWMQKSIDFHLLHYEITQLSSCYCAGIIGVQQRVISRRRRSIMCDDECLITTLAQLRWDKNVAGL